MNQTPKISVYITNFNYGKFIKESIESVLSQSCQEFELIVIDDGSTDDSKAIIETYAQHPKVTIIYQQNKGLNISNNIALRIARGKYLIRLDADDYLHKDALHLLSQQLDADGDVGLVFPDYYVVDIEGHVISEIKRHDFDKEVTLFDQPAHGACTMTRLEFLRNMGGYDESFSCQDGYDLWIKFIDHHKVRNVKQPLFYYRQHGTNLTRNENRLLTTRMAMQEKYIQNSQKVLPKTIGIIPVRSLHVSRLAFEKLGDKTLLELKVRSALQSELLEKIVIAASDNEVFALVSEHFDDERIVLIERPHEYARYNASLLSTLRLIMGHPKLESCQAKAFVLLALEFPFLHAQMIDSAIRTATIFEADTVISVRMDADSHYKHNGSTMLPIHNESLTKYERDDLYVARGGLVFSTYDNFVRHERLPSGRVGHIIVDQIGSMSVTTATDLSIAEYIYENAHKFDTKLNRVV